MSSCVRAVKPVNASGTRCNVAKRVVLVKCEGKAADAKLLDGLTEEQRAQMETAMADPEVRRFKVAGGRIGAHPAMDLLLP